MEIKKVDDSLLIDLVSAARETEQKSKIEDLLNTQPNAQVLDSFDSNSFASLKLSIAQAKEPGREEYIDGIKSAVNAGTYNVSDEDLVAALFQDGFADALNSL